MILSKYGTVLLSVTNEDIDNGDFVTPTGVTSIGDNAFRDCSHLNKLTLPEGLTRIGYDAFSGCIAMQTIVIDTNSSEEVERIKNYFLVIDRDKIIQKPHSDDALLNPVASHSTYPSQQTSSLGILGIGPPPSQQHMGSRIHGYLNYQTDDVNRFGNNRFISSSTPLRREQFVEADSGSYRAEQSEREMQYISRRNEEQRSRQSMATHNHVLNNFTLMRL